jgi:hypothetical protein
MSDTVEGHRAPAEEEAGGTQSPSAAVILAGLGERREGARITVQEPCTVFIGSHVHDAVLRDVSEGGAMLHGLRGLLTGDAVRLRVGRLSEHVFTGEVRGISLLGVHVAIGAPAESALWRDVVRALQPDAEPQAGR